MTVKTKTKADVVRQILGKIGAISEDPPENWKTKTEAELKKRKLKVHQTQIYDIRRKEMSKSGLAIKSRGKSSAKSKSKSTTASVAAKRSWKRRKNNAEELNFSSALKIKQFADQFGGLSRLQGHVEKIMTLTGELNGK